jgi:hypothetical protein
MVQPACSAARGGGGASKLSALQVRSRPGPALAAGQGDAGESSGRGVGDGALHGLRLGSYCCPPVGGKDDDGDVSPGDVLLKDHAVTDTRPTLWWTLTVRRRGDRKRALGTRAPMALPQGPDQRWSLDFVSDVLADGPTLPGVGRCRRLHPRVPGAGRRYLDLRPPGGARARRHRRGPQERADDRQRQRHRGPFDTNGARTGAGSRDRQCKCPAVGTEMLDMGLRRFFWRIVGGCDYWVTLTRLRILGVLAGSELETPADLQRRHDQQRIERAFPKIEPRGVGSTVAIRADHLRPHCQIAQNGSGDRRGGGRRLGRRALRTAT